MNPFYLVALVWIGAVSLGQTLEFKRATPPGTASGMSDIVFGDGKFVAIWKGTPIYSLDGGSSWSEANIMEKALAVVVYAGGQFVAAGSRREVATSSDGINWVVRNYEPAYDSHFNFSFIAYGAGVYVVTGALPALVSNDGATWTAVSSDGLSGPIAYGNGKFLSLPRYSNFPAPGMESVDGKQWTTVTNDIPKYSGIDCDSDPTGCNFFYGVTGLIYARDRFITQVFYSSQGVSQSSGVLFSSTDSRTWASIASADPQSDRRSSGLSELDGRIVTTAGIRTPFGDSPGYVLVIPPNPGDFIRSYRTPLPMLRIVGIAGTYIGVAEDPFYSNGGIWRTARLEVESTNEWKLLSPPEQTLFSTAARGNLVVGVGEGYDNSSSPPSARIIASTNRLRTTFQASLPSGSGGLQSIRHADGRFVAVGKGGTIVRSFDGVAWSKRVSNTASDLCDITYGAGLWVAVGSGGKIVTSPDASSFSQRFSGTDLPLKGITYSGSKFLCVGLGGAILTSPNGLDWTSVGEDSIDLSSVTFGDGLFVATGTNGIFRASWDGVSWYTRQIPGAIFPARVAFANGFFVANEAALVGPGTGGTYRAPDTYYYSLGGIEWKSSRIPEAVLHGVDSVENEIFLSGPRSTLWKTQLGSTDEPVLRARMDPPGRVILILTTPFAGDFAIESKSDLTSGVWQTEATFRGVSSTATWSNHTPTARSVFYRATKL